MPPADVLRRHGARVLDPTDAVLRPGDRLRPTVYRTDRLILSQSVVTDPAMRSTLDTAAAELGLSLTLEEGTGAGYGVGADLVGVRALLSPAPGRPVSPDAWHVLQLARAMHHPHPLTGATLDHLMFAGRQPMTLVPFHDPNGVGGAPTVQYAEPGGGGRQPVAVIGAPPLRSKVLGRRPVVAVLDTGCASHPWLDRCVTRDLVLTSTTSGAARLVGYRGPDVDDIGDLVGPLDGGLDAFAGHGTAICGMVHQTCPDADIVSVRVVQPDGVVEESHLVGTLGQLYELAHRHVRGLPGGFPIDVVSLSLGCYYEAPFDPAFQPELGEILRKLGELGVAVVAAAGNDATSRAMFPAAWSPNGYGPLRTTAAHRVPLISIGAQNPNLTVALFSNSGPWVCGWEIGASVVTTMPRFDAGANPVRSTMDPTGQRRESVDPDDFSGGFGVWSGTSFAAPIFAGRLARKLLELAYRRTTAIPLDDPGRAVERGWRAIEELTALRPPSAYPPRPVVADGKMRRWPG